MIRVKGYLTPARRMENGVLVVDGKGEPFDEDFPTVAEVGDWVMAEVVCGRQVLITDMA